MKRYKKLILENIYNRNLKYEIVLNNDLSFMINCYSEEKNHSFTIKLDQSERFGDTISFFGYNINFTENLSDESLKKVFESINLSINYGVKLFAYSINTNEISEIAGCYWIEHNLGNEIELIKSIKCAYNSIKDNLFDNTSNPILWKFSCFNGSHDRIYKNVHDDSDIK